MEESTIGERSQALREQGECDVLERCVACLSDDEIHVFFSLKMRLLEIA